MMANYMPKNDVIEKCAKAIFGSLLAINKQSSILVYNNYLNTIGNLNKIPYNSGSLVNVRDAYVW